MICPFARRNCLIRLLQGEVSFSENEVCRPIVFVELQCLQRLFDCTFGVTHMDEVTGPHSAPVDVQRVLFHSQIHFAYRLWKSAKGLQIEAGVCPVGLGGCSRTRQGGLELAPCFIPTVLMRGSNRAQ